MTASSSSQRFDWSWRQNQQAPHAGTNEAMTRSPFLTRRHLGADLVDGAGALVAEDRRRRQRHVPFMTERSEWHTPLAPISTTTSRGPGIGWRHLLDDEGLVLPDVHGCFHGSPSVRSPTLALRRAPPASMPVASAPVVRLLLVRHGQSTWNAESRWQGQADPPLSALGERQAEQRLSIWRRLTRSRDLGV